MAEHTPQAWTTKPCGCGFCSGYRVYRNGVKIDDLFSREVAELMVRACNCHDDLLEACEAALEYVAMQYDSLDGNQWEVDRRLRAAIAKAKDKP